MVLVASALCGVIGLARRRGTHTKARRHEETETRRDGGGEALGCTPCEAAHPPPARGTHEGTKARRHEETEARIGLGSGFHYFILLAAAFTPYGKQ